MKPGLEQWSFLWTSGHYVLHSTRKSDQDSLDDCVIYNCKEHSILRIEDNNLYAELKRIMKAAGVSVIRGSPLGENILNKVQRELVNAGLSFEKIKQAYAELKAMKEAGLSNASIDTRLNELISEMKKST